MIDNHGLPFQPELFGTSSVAFDEAYAGVQRIADDLMPALLGPVLDRLPTLTRTIFVMDGALRDLPIGELPFGDGASLSQRLPIAIVDDGALLDEIGRAPSPAPPALAAWPMPVLVTSAAVAILIVAAVAALRRRSSVP